MNRKKWVPLVVGVLAALVLAAAATAATGSTAKVNMKLGGEVLNIGEVALFDISTRGRVGRTPAWAEVRGLAYSEFASFDNLGLPEDSGCDDIGFPSGLIVTDARLNAVFLGGSLVYGQLAEPGYLCFVPGLLHAEYAITGGTGRFEGASGRLVFDMNTYVIDPDSSDVIPETGTVSGEIILP